MTTDENIIEIVWKQRYLLLLQKVKSNQTLSKTEISELRKYESRASRKNPTAKRVPAKTPTRKSAISRAEVKQLALECENMTVADTRKDQITRDRKSLPEILDKHPKLKAAWDRGRFLRNLEGLARKGASITEAAKKLKLANGRILRAMIDKDIEVGDLWDQTQLAVTLELKAGIMEAAMEGKTEAIRAVEKFLVEDKEHPDFDVSHITTLQLIDLIGKTRTTIHEWVTRFGLPRNIDNTFDGVVIEF